MEFERSGGSEAVPREGHGSESLATSLWSKLAAARRELTALHEGLDEGRGPSAVAAVAATQAAVTARGASVPRSSPSSPIARDLLHVAGGGERQRTRIGHQTQNPKPQILNAKAQALNSIPKVINPKP